MSLKSIDAGIFLDLFSERKVSSDKRENFRFSSGPKGL